MSDATRFDRTRCYCCDCSEHHPASYVADQGEVILEVECPRAPRRVKVSSDAATFRAIRARSALGSPPLESVRGFSWINFLEITRDCNCTCPVCYAGSRPGGGGTLSLAEVERIARRLKREGLTALSLTGGEPTLHPELLEIIAAVRRVGLEVTLISNGLRLGREPGLARRIRKRGVAYVYLQLDTLRPEVCLLIRGDDRVADRTRAIEQATRSGLRVGINVTVVRENLEEVGALLRHAKQHAPRLGLVTYLAAGRTGRFELPPESCVDREQVIGALCRSGEVEGLRADHFWPFPRFAPIGLDLHPDCGVLLPLALDRGRLRPLDDYLDVAVLFRSLSEAGGAIDRRRATLLFSAHFLRAVRPGRRAAVARMLFGFFSGRGSSSILTVVCEQFLDGQHQDQERIDRCTTCSVVQGGERISHCVFQHADPRRSPLTRAAGAGVASIP